MAYSPLACLPHAIPRDLRSGHFALAARLFNETALGSEALQDGYAIRFPIAALALLTQFVRNERLCCPFLDFAILIRAGADELVLRMTGPEGTREVLDAELGLDQRRPTSMCACHGD